MSMELWLQTAPADVGRCRLLVIAVLAGLLFASADAHAAGGAKRALSDESRPASAEPVHIESQRLEADMNAHSVEFSGQVRVVREAYTLTADSLSIFFKPPAEGQRRLQSGVSAKDASNIAARGRVVIRSQGLTAFSDAAEYDPDTGRATLWGEKPAAVRSVPGGGIASATGPTVGGVTPTGRVRVVLVPTAKPR